MKGVAKKRIAGELVSEFFGAMCGLRSKIRLTMQIMFILFLMAAFTAVCLIVGISLLFWRKTRPLGLYALMVEPGGVLGLVLAAFIWREFLSLIRPNLGPRQNLDWVAWMLIVLALVWFGTAAIAGVVAGFSLATWLWWRFSPEPYRSKIVSWYKRFLAMPPLHRQRWSQRRDTRLSAPLDSE